MVAPLDRHRPAQVGDDVAGEIARRAGGKRSVDPRIDRQDDVEHLRLAGIFRPVQIARPKLDPHHAVGRNARQQGRQRFGFGARPRAVEHDIARRAGKAADVVIALLERESGYALGDVERIARRERHEEGGVISSDPRGLCRHRHCRHQRDRRDRNCQVTHGSPLYCCANTVSADRAIVSSPVRPIDQRIDGKGSGKGVAERVAAVITSEDCTILCDVTPQGTPSYRLSAICEFDADQRCPLSTYNDRLGDIPLSTRFRRLDAIRPSLVSADSSGHFHFMKDGSKEGLGETR